MTPKYIYDDDVNDGDLVDPTLWRGHKKKVRFKIKDDEEVSSIPRMIQTKLDKVDNTIADLLFGKNRPR